MELQEDVLRAMIGKNADHYLEKFKQLERGEKTKFQWSALFIGPAFVLYRKCNELFMKYFAVPCAMAVLSSLSMSVGSGLIFSNMDASFALTAAGNGPVHRFERMVPGGRHHAGKKISQTVFGTFKRFDGTGAD